MNQKKLRQPQALLAGICMLLATILWHICSGLPMGYVNIFNTIEYLIRGGFADVGSFMESLIWTLVFVAWVFSGIALITANPKVSCIALLLLGGLYLIENLMIMILWVGAKYLLEQATSVAIILAGLAVAIRKKGLITAAYIFTMLGFLTDLIYRIMLIHDQVMNTDYSNEVPLILRGVIIILANLVLVAGLMLASSSAKNDFKPSVSAPSYGPYQGQPQQPYGQAPYQAQPQQPYGQASYQAQPQQPYVQPQQQFAQPQQPYVQPQQPYAQPQQPPQPFAQPGMGQAPYVQPNANTAQQATYQPSPSLAVQQEQSFEDKTTVLPDDDYPEKDPTVIM